jgi:glycosyltransferase involved in cell wall biosynthesis
MNASVDMNILGIGPVSPPITGPGLKNKYLIEGLTNEGVELDWVDTLNGRAKAPVNIIQSSGYDGYIISESTKGRVVATSLLYPRLRHDDSFFIMLPMGGELHNEIRRLPEPISRLYSHGLREYDGIFPESDYLSNKLSGELGVNQMISTVPNLRPYPEKRPEKLSMNTESLKLTYVGRIKEQKGVLDAISSVASSRAQGYNVSLDIYGQFLQDSDFKQIFLDKVTKTEEVKYKGKIPEGSVIDTMGQYHALVFPSYYPGEGFPGVLIEAQMAGCALIVSDWKSNSELVNAGENGILFEPRNKKQLSSILSRLSSNPALVSSMMSRSRENSDRYSVENVSSQILARIKTVVGDVSKWNS